MFCVDSILSRLIATYTPLPNSALLKVLPYFVCTRSTISKRSRIDYYWSIRFVLQFTGLCDSALIACPFGYAIAYIPVLLVSFLLFNFFDCLRQNPIDYKRIDN